MNAAFKINPYLTFNGSCREAMQFYRECLGGRLRLQTVGESPMASQWPAAMQQRILHSSLVKGDVTLLASDMGNARARGGLISLALACRNEREIQLYFSRLSQGGKVTHPLHQFFDGTIGALTDRFGTNWVLKSAK